MRDSSSRSSIVRAARWPRRPSLGQPTDDLGVVARRPAPRPARRARRPGVFSSWLMLATKSVRTASSRARSLTSSTVASANPVVQRFGVDQQHRPRRAGELHRLGPVVPARRTRTAARPLLQQHRLVPAGAARRRCSLLSLAPSGRRAPPRSVSASSARAQPVAARPRRLQRPGLDARHRFRLDSHRQSDDDEASSRASSPRRAPSSASRRVVGAEAEALRRRCAPAASP